MMTVAVVDNQDVVEFCVGDQEAMCAESKWVEEDVRVSESVFGENLVTVGVPGGLGILSFPS